MASVYSLTDPTSLFLSFLSSLPSSPSSLPSSFHPFLLLHGYSGCRVKMLVSGLWLCWMSREVSPYRDTIVHSNIGQLYMTIYTKYNVLHCTLYCTELYFHSTSILCTVRKLKAPGILNSVISVMYNV